jgi:hypothetical protein
VRVSRHLREASQAALAEVAKLRTRSQQEQETIAAVVAGEIH